MSALDSEGAIIDTARPPDAQNTNTQKHECIRGAHKPVTGFVNLELGLVRLDKKQKQKQKHTNECSALCQAGFGGMKLMLGYFLRIVFGFIS